MDDIPDWLRHWLALKIIERSGIWFWTNYGRICWQVANHELMSLFVWYHIVVADMIEAISESSHQEELEPATNYNVVVEEMRSGSLDSMLEINPYAAIGNRIFSASKLTPYPFVSGIVQASLGIKPLTNPYTPFGNIVPKNLRPPISNLSGSFTKFDSVYPFVRYQPMTAKYRPPVFSGVRAFLSHNYPIAGFKPQVYSRVFHSSDRSKWSQGIVEEDRKGI